MILLALVSLITVLKLIQLQQLKPSGKHMVLRMMTGRPGLQILIVLKIVENPLSSTKEAIVSKCKAIS